MWCPLFRNSFNKMPPLQQHIHWRLKYVRLLASWLNATVNFRPNSMKLSFSTTFSFGHIVWTIAHVFHSVSDSRTFRPFFLHELFNFARDVDESRANIDPFPPLCVFVPIQVACGKFIRQTWLYWHHGATIIKKRNLMVIFLKFRGNSCTFSQIVEYFINHQKCNFLATGFPAKVMAYHSIEVCWKFTWWAWADPYEKSVRSPYRTSSASMVILWIS